MNNNTKEILKKSVILVMALFGVLAFLLPIAAVGEGRGAMLYGGRDINGFKLISLLNDGASDRLIFQMGFRLKDSQLNLWIIINLLMLLATVGAIVFATLNTVGKKDKKHIVKIVMIISFSVAFLCLLEWLVIRFTWIQNNRWISAGYKTYVPWVFVIDLILSVVYMVLNNSFESKSLNKTNTNPWVEEGYYSLGKHIVFLLIFPGIWTYIWMYRTTKVLNKVTEEVYSDPLKKLLLCIFIPFYQIYWFYKQGQKLDVWSKKKNSCTSDKATLCLIFAIFIPFVASIIMQDGINAVCRKMGTQSSVKVEKQGDNNVKEIKSVPEQLKEYKELLDLEVITQQEFDEKKQQLLGL